MSEIKDGGPAFPSAGSHEYRSGWDSTQVRTYSFDGLTKREWFAAMANENDVAYAMERIREKTRDMNPTRAQARYLHADAMIQELEGGK